MDMFSTDKFALYSSMATDMQKKFSGLECNPIYERFDIYPDHIRGDISSIHCADSPVSAAFRARAFSRPPQLIDGKKTS
jgi:hypothetical protein